MSALEDLKRLAYENACCRCQYYDNGECKNDKGECVWLNIRKELEKRETKYVHHTLEEAVHNLACLAFPITKMEGLVNNLYKDCEEQIEASTKEHEALGIIKRDPKHVIYALDLFPTYSIYRDYCEHNRVTKEPIQQYIETSDEFDLLKGILK